MRKSIEAIMEDMSKLTTIVSNCVSIIGYGSYFRDSVSFDEKKSDIDLCVVVEGDVLLALTEIEERDRCGLKMGWEPGEYHVWILNEDSLKPSPLTGYMHEHSRAIINEGIILWSRS